MDLSPNSLFAKLAKALDLHIRSDVIVDVDLHQSQVIAVTENFETQTGLTSDGDHEEITRKSFVEALGANWDVCDDGASQYMKSISNLDHDADSILWWRVHEISFPNLTLKARDLLSIQATTVSSTSVFQLLDK